MALLSLCSLARLRLGARCARALTTAGKAAGASGARAFSTAGKAAGPSATLDHAGSAAVVGACYIGAGLWLYNDWLEKPKAAAAASSEQHAAPALTSKIEGLADELASIRELIESMDEVSRWKSSGCRTGPLVVVGTGGGADSIFMFRVSPDHASLEPVGTPLKVGANPSFVSAAADADVLYVAHEGAASAVALDARAPSLELLGAAQSACGAGTCYVEPDAHGRHVLVANYVGGSVAVLPILGDGSLGPASDCKQHVGASAKAELHDRQESAHPHSIRVEPTEGRWALVPDLGLDRLHCYAYDPERGSLAGAPDAPRHWRAPEGAGPRHLAFSPPSHGASPRVYLLSELAGTVSVLALDQATGALSELQTVSLLPHFVPPTREPHCGSGEVAMHPSGKFLYATNRQNHSISVLSVDDASGRVSLRANVPCGGRTPRHFQISPAGDYLVVANQASHDLATFRIEQASGMLSKPRVTPLPASPRCICIVDGSARQGKLAPSGRG